MIKFESQDKALAFVSIKGWTIQRVSPIVLTVWDGTIKVGVLVDSPFDGVMYIPNKEKGKEWIVGKTILESTGERV